MTSCIQTNLKAFVALAQRRKKIILHKYSGLITPPKEDADERWQLGNYSNSAPLSRLFY